MTKLSGATEAEFRKTLAPIKSFYTRRGNAAGMKMPSLEPAQTQTNPLWDNDLIQFARLLAELRGSGALTETIWNELMSSMDLESTDLEQLFDRADAVWEKSKRENSPVRR